MTPRFGFLRRTALGLALGSGLTAACAVGPSPDAEPSTVEHPVLAEPDRRVELGELSRLPTEQPPLGGARRDRSEPRAARDFVDVAAVATVDAIPEDAQGLCWPATPGAFCLTITDHAADLAALDDLEIVDVAGVVRDNAQVDGVCYSSWETVSEDVCMRALKAHAIVEATADFPSRRAPEEPGD